MKHWKTACWCAAVSLCLAKAAGAETHYFKNQVVPTDVQPWTVKAGCEERAQAIRTERSKLLESLRPEYEARKKINLGLLKELRALAASKNGRTAFFAQPDLEARLKRRFSASLDEQTEFKLTKTPEGGKAICLTRDYFNPLADHELAKESIEKCKKATPKGTSPMPDCLDAARERKFEGVERRFRMSGEVCLGTKTILYRTLSDYSVELAAVLSPEFYPSIEDGTPASQEIVFLKRKLPANCMEREAQKE